MDRVIVFSHEDVFQFELSESEVYELRRHEEINGEHRLTITTTAVLQKEQRILTQDATGKWYEWVVTTEDMEHAGGTYMVGTYMAVWSMQHDLSTVPVSAMVGVSGTPVGAEQALTSLLSTTDRWEVGTVTVTTVSGASFYRTLVWSGLSTLVGAWGGEVDAEITVDNMRVTSRAVSLLDHLGSSEATRRFDYGADLVSIKRKVESDPLACRIIPLGKGEQSGDGYGRKITIEGVNGGKDYLQNDSVVPYVRRPSSDGYEYPTIYAENSNIETPAELKAWGEGVLEYLTEPRVTYEATVLQLSQAGMDAYGIALGDLVHCVDRKFLPEGLRVSGRVTCIDANLLDPSDTKVTIGHLSKSLSTTMRQALGRLDSRIDTAIAVSEGVAGLSQAYVTRIIERLNEEINLTGGYFYITEGQGVRTYDTAVSDPLVGTEASQVVEIRGGNIRIANSRTSSGDWDWKTVIQSGHLAIDLVTAARLVAGYIGSPSGNYWNLDTGEFQLAATASIGGKTVSEIIGAVEDISTQEAIFNLLTNNGTIEGLYMRNGQLYVNGTYIYGGTIVAGGSNNENGVILVKDASGATITTLDKDGVSITDGRFLLSSGTHSVGFLSLTGDTKLLLEETTLPSLGGTSQSVDVVAYSLKEHYNWSETSISNPSFDDAEMYLYTSKGVPYITAKGHMLVWALNDLSNPYGPRSSLDLNGYSSGSYFNLEAAYGSTRSYIYGTHSGGILISTYPDGSGKLDVSCDLEVGSRYTKSKIASTDNYGERTLYCYETPTPMFGDVGSGTIGDDGVCYVEIDDVFSETVNVGTSYQVFLQACGRGELWVEEKHPNHFVVMGEAGLHFDWEVKSSQRGFEQLRLEDRAISQIVSEEMDVSTPESAYEDELDYVGTIESMYDEDLAA